MSGADEFPMQKHRLAMGETACLPRRLQGAQ
jgi:hypothetical protein